MPIPIEDDDDDDGMAGGGDEDGEFYSGDIDDLDGGSSSPKRGVASPNSSFQRIVGEMISTGYTEKHPPDNLLMEIKGFKFAQNKVWFASCYFLGCRRPICSPKMTAMLLCLYLVVWRLYPWSCPRTSNDQR